MDETTSVLFGLDGHRVLDVVGVEPGVVRVVIEDVEERTWRMRMAARPAG